MAHYPNKSQAEARFVNRAEVLDEVAPGAEADERGLWVRHGASPTHPVGHLKVPGRAVPTGVAADQNPRATQPFREVELGYGRGRCSLRTPSGLARSAPGRPRLADGQFRTPTARLRRCR